MLQKILVGILYLPCLGIAWNPRGDLEVYYKVSRFILEGNISKLYSENASLGNFFYGPLGLVLLTPLGFGSYQTAHWIWVALNTFSYIIFWKLLFKLFPLLLEKKARLLFLIVWIASIKPIHASFQSFNVQLFCAAVLLYAEYLRQNQKAFLGYLFVTLLSLIKIFPIFILAYYFFLKPKPVFKAILLGLFLSLLAPALFFGLATSFQLHYEFVKNLFTYHHAYPLATGTYLLSLPSLLAFLGWSQITPILIIFISLLYLFRKNPTLSSWALGLSLMVFLNSVSRVDYFVFYVPAYAALISHYLLHQKKEKWFLLLVFISLGLLAFVNEWTLGSRELNHQLEAYRVPVYGMIILVALLSHHVIKSKDPRALTSLS